MSLLVIWEILWLFVNTLAAMTSILSVIVRIYRNQVLCNYLKIKNIFLYFLLLFWNLHETLKILKKKDDLHNFNISEIMDCETRG